MKPNRDLHEVCGFLLSNTRLLVAQSRMRIGTFQILKKHTEAHQQASRLLVLSASSATRR